VFASRNSSFGSKQITLNSKERNETEVGSKSLASKLSCQLIDLDGDLTMPNALYNSSKSLLLLVLLDFTLSFNAHIGKDSFFAPM